jgi:hypothetical protein
MTSNIANLGASTPSQECGKSLRIPIERTSKRLRLFAAAHVERWASQPERHLARRVALAMLRE